ncbi:MAG: fibronectin type III domain-containing protein [Candidatus Spechtbacterales bacterium]|nr:fibronectin type III domain-containing protein [Candidatus Spechtbacterales bacterium]
MTALNLKNNKKNKTLIFGGLGLLAGALVIMFIGGVFDSSVDESTAPLAANVSQRVNQINEVIEIRRDLFEALGEGEDKKVRVLSVGNDSATLIAEVTDMGGADTVDVYFEYGESRGDLDQETDAVSIRRPSPVRAVINDLKSGTTYYFKAIAVNESEQKTETDILTFTTNSASDRPEIGEEDAINVTGNSATLVGSIDDTGEADTIRVSFVWGTSRVAINITTPSQTKTSDQIQTGNNEFSEDIFGLEPGKTYYYKVVAENEVGRIESEVREFETNTAAPSFTVSKFGRFTPYTRIKESSLLGRDDPFSAYRRELADPEPEEEVQ